MYHIFLGLYNALIIASYPFYPKAKKFIDGRKNWKEKLAALDFKKSSWIWVHFCSYGEYQDGKFFVFQLKEKYPNTKFIYTFHSPSGYEVLKNSAEADHIYYLPLDYRKNTEYFINTVNPQLIIFCRNDIWFNYLKTANKKNIPVVHISTLINQNSGFLKFPFFWHYKKAFYCFNLLLTQNKETKDILQHDFKCKNVSIIGNTRIDSIFQRFEKKTHYPEIEKFVNGNFCMIGGSILKKDLRYIFQAHQKLNSHPIKWIIVPHEPAELSNEFLSHIPKDQIILYSEINNLNSSHSVLIIDCVGILMDLYQYSNLSYISGGFSKIGIHNILEPCVYGNKILIGPNHRNYQEAIDLIDMRVCEIIENENDLYKKIVDAFENKTQLENIYQKGAQYISSKRGATQLAISEINKLIPAEKQT